jgi:predicted esterase
MAYSLALHTPTRFTALTAQSTWLPSCLQARLPALAAQPFPPTLVHHGTRDRHIEVVRARRSRDALRTAHLPITYHEFDMDHEMTRQSLAELSTWIDEKIDAPAPVRPASSR